MTLRVMRLKEIPELIDEYVDDNFDFRFNGRYLTRDSKDEMYKLLSEKGQTSKKITIFEKSLQSLEKSTKEAPKATLRDLNTLTLRNQNL